MQKTKGKPLNVHCEFAKFQLRTENYEKFVWFLRKKLLNFTHCSESFIYSKYEMIKLIERLQLMDNSVLHS